MGTSQISCNCNKTCNENPYEYELQKGDYLRSKSGNIKIRTEIKGLERNHNNQIRHSSLFKPNNLDKPSTISNNEYMKEKNFPYINKLSEDNNNLEFNHEPIKTLIQFDSQNLDESENENDNEKYDEYKTNFAKNGIKEFQINSINNEIKYIPNFDKQVFFSKKLKNAEKNFKKPLNYINDFQKYYKEDDDNIDLLILINTMSNNKGESHTKKDGEVLEYRGEKYLYIGETDKNQLPTGFGILYTQGQKYEGNFFRGKLIGLGRYINAEGTCFEGIFEDNKLVSKATIITKNENKKRVEYFGEVKDFKKNGKGKEICEDEYIYIGDFINDLKHGFGKLEYYENGEIYEGEFYRGEITGKGIYIWSNGEQYEGDFINGIKHGKGIYTWPDGCEYEGEYNNGKREGKGQYMWEDGRIFEGNFKNGKPDGKGKIYYKGKAIKCEYKNGVPDFDIKNSFKFS